MFNKGSRGWFLVFNTLVLVSMPLATPPAAWAKTPDEIKADVQSMLAERHPDNKPERWLALGSEAPEVIIQLYELNENTSQRVRLLTGLSFFSESASAVEFIKKQIDQSPEPIIKNEAIKNLATSRGAKELSTISKHLKDPNEQTRLAAALSIKQMDDPTAQQVLAQYLKGEKTPWIASRVEGQLPKPTKALPIATSSEDGLNKYFEGLWQGYFLFPSSENGEVQLEKATVKLELKTPSTLTGEITVYSKDKPSQTFPIASARGKASTFNAQVPASLGIRTNPKSTKKLPMGLEAEIREEAGVQLLEIHISKAAATLLLSKKTK